MDEGDDDDDVMDDKHDPLVVKIDTVTSTATAVTPVIELYNE